MTSAYRKFISKKSWLSLPLVISNENSLNLGKPPSHLHIPYYFNPRSRHSPLCKYPQNSSEAWIIPGLKHHILKQKRQREIAHLLIQAPNALSSQDWARLQLRAWDSTWVSHASEREPKTWAITYCHLGSRELYLQQSHNSKPGIATGAAGIQSGTLNAAPNTCPTILPLNINCSQSKPTCTLWLCDLQRASWPLYTSIPNL